MENALLNYLMVQPMPIQVDEGIHFNLTPCANVMMIITCIVGMLVLIGFSLAIVFGVYGREDLEECMMEISLFLMLLAVICFWIFLLCNLIGL